MRNELKRKIRSICAEAGTQAASQKCTEIIEQLEGEFDSRIRAGMSELDAYRDVLKNVDSIKEMVKNLPRTDDEAADERNKASAADLKRILGAVSTVMWLLIVIAYILISFSFGRWHLTWLIFLWGAIVQSILDMVLKINEGKQVKKIMRSGISSVMWLVIVIIYFIGSFTTGAWYISWLIFIFGAIIETVINAIFGK